MEVRPPAPMRAAAGSVMLGRCEGCRGESDRRVRATGVANIVAAKRRREVLSGTECDRQERHGGQRNMCDL